MQTIKVKHNVEMAHRLYETPGKCEKIHGHSWWIELELGGAVNQRGLLEGLDFGTVKKSFRKFLDEEFDHRVLLNKRDPWAQTMYNAVGDSLLLPGLQVFEADPTTENIAGAIGIWACQTFPMCFSVQISAWETSVNNSTWRWEHGPE